MGISYKLSSLLVCWSFFFSLGVFAATRWGFDKWKKKQKPRKMEKVKPN